jgi:uncharacterized protein
MRASMQTTDPDSGIPDSTSLIIVDSCTDCGACCMLTPVPPFEPGEEEAYDLSSDQRLLIAERVDSDEHFEKLPCVWFDPELRQCRYYDQRPDACRRFEIGSTLCRLSRCDIGLPG